MKQVVLAFSLLLLVTAPDSYARPVAYKGATTIQFDGFPDLAGIRANYNITRNFSLGARIMHTEDEFGTGATLAFNEVNFLVKRWFAKDSQGNLYVSGGPGIADTLGQQKFAYFAGASADWETRRIYTAATFETFRAPDLMQMDRARGRFGFAPYLASFTELNTWIVFQVAYNEGLDEEISPSPLLRMFYKNVLWELGMSFRGNMHIHFLTEF